MKIIGEAKDKHYIVEIPHDEMAKLLGFIHDLHDFRIFIEPFVGTDKKIKIAEMWNQIYTLKKHFDKLNEISSQCKEISDVLKSFDLPNVYLESDREMKDRKDKDEKQKDEEE